MTESDAGRRISVRKMLYSIIGTAFASMCCHTFITAFSLLGKLNALRLLQKSYKIAEWNIHREDAARGVRNEQG